MSNSRRTKIIFIIESIFNLRDYHRFGISILTQRGFQVGIWDLSAYLAPEYYKNYTPPDPINFINHITIRRKSEVDNLLQGLNSQDYVVALFSVNRKSLYIVEYLYINKINYGSAAFGTLPFSITQLSLGKKIKRAIGNPQQFLLNAYHLLARQKLKLPPLNFIIVGGSTQKKAVIKRQDFGEKTNIIDAHALDYDRFLEEEQTSEKRIIEGDYMVFLDEFGPYHPDNLSIFREPDVNMDTYYTDMNNFFNLLEADLGIQVVIAAHPRSNYDKMENPFGGRKIIFANTIRLVKYAQIVLIHASTAVNFAVLYFKPLCFLSSSDYSIHYLHMIDSMAKNLSKKVIDISDYKYIPSDYLSVDNTAYKKYKELFIKIDGTPEKNVWEIFADFIEQKNN